MLTEMLEQNIQFQSLPATQRTITLRLAELFESDEMYLTLTPAELAKNPFSIGSKQQWHEFLQFEAVKAYIKGQMASLATVASRKAFQSLATEAAGGNTNAARQVNELAGILNNDSSRVIVLHQIARPKTNNTQTEVTE